MPAYTRLTRSADAYEKVFFRASGAHACSRPLLRRLADSGALEPSEDFYVNDQAGTLSASTKELIDNASGPLEQECDGAQIVVVTINYLPSGYDSEQYAWQLFNDWGVGSDTANNGMLLLHVVQEDRGWLAVGQGLTNQISTDEINGLLDEYFWPLSDAGQYDEAVASLFPHLIDIYEEIYSVELYGGTSDTNQGYVEPYPGYDDYYYESQSRGGSIYVTVFVILAALIVLSAVIGSVGGAAGAGATAACPCSSSAAAREVPEARVRLAVQARARHTAEAAASAAVVLAEAALAEEVSAAAASAEADVPVAAAAADRHTNCHTYCCTPFAIGKRGAFISFL